MKPNRIKVLVDTYKTGIHLLISLAVFLCLSAVIYEISRYCGWSDYLFGGQEDAADKVFNLFLTEVQVSFVVVSLSTVLSTSTKKVYWVDCFQYRLVSPRFFNFTALCSYILSSLILGAIWIVLGKIWSDTNAYFGVILSFILSLLWMIVLSVSMIDANFGKEEIKIQLKKKLRKKICRTEREELVGVEYNMLPYVCELKNLEFLTYREIDDKEMELVYENIDLFLELDQSQTVKKIIRYANKSISTSEMRDELYYEIVKSAVRRHSFYTEYNHTVHLMPDVFYTEYGIPVKNQIGALKRVLDDEFSRARKLRKHNESVNIGLRLYKILIYTLSYYRGIIHNYKNDADIDVSTIKEGIVDLMASFVYYECYLKDDILDAFKKDAEDIYFQSLPDDRVQLLKFAEEIIGEFEKTDDEEYGFELSWYYQATEF